jgi:hypothetical protein
MMMTYLRITLLILIVPTLHGIAEAQDRFHVFPQIADGYFADGSYYRSTLMVSNAFSLTPADCALQLYGLTARLGSMGLHDSFPITVPGNYGWAYLRTGADQTLKTGYATLTCSTYVYAEILYSFYASDGSKLSEATVFSSGPGFQLRLIADQTEGAKLGIAIANNSDISQNVTVTVTSDSDAAVGSATITIPARSSIAKFADELIPSSVNRLCRVTIQSPDYADFYVIGLRFTGRAFTTIPAH